MAKQKGLYANIHAKRKRIAAGSKEKMRKPGSKGAPTKANFVRSAKTAKETYKEGVMASAAWTRKEGKSKSGGLMLKVEPVIKVAHLKHLQNLKQVRDVNHFVLVWVG